MPTLGMCARFLNGGRGGIRLAAVALILICASSLMPAETKPAPDDEQPVPARVVERVEVVATRTPADPQEVPISVEVFTGEELRRRGVTDLAGALALAAGIHIAPGGDGGPASSVPEFRGLREFDAFLLVVDGVPWGGAFNPALSTLSLQDVERIEVLRGPAPVTYGATSFVGAIHVVRSGAASRSTYAGLRGGSFGSGGVFADLPLLQRREWSSRLSVDANRQGYPDDRTGYDRGHFLWRTQRERGGGSKMWFHADGAWVNQDPSSPLPADGGRFLDDFSIDANFNPRHSYLDDRRFTAGFGCDRAFGAARWSLQSSVSRADQEIFRGFLGDPIAPGVSQGNGIRESIDRTDIYVDTHWTLAAARNVSLVLGGDLLHGQAKAEGAEFDYRVRIDGSHAASVSEPGDLPIRIDDRRDFLGAYGLAEWAATKRLRVSGGLRVNATLEEREGEADATPAPGMEEETLRQSNLRLSGSAGLLYSLWERRADHFRLYGNYRDTFKPAAIDFGIGEEPGGGEAELLDPETSRSVEVGAKSTFGAGRYSVEGGLFWMELRNLVTATSVNGLPALVNAGRERFRGVETAGDVRLGHDVGLRATYSFHDATFRDFVQDFGGVPTQLAGNRLEMSARHLASAGVVHAPDHGILLLAELQYVGSRYLNRRNTSLAEPFTTLGAGIGYRFDRWEVRLDARNLTDERPPVSESELGDGQYYPLPARRVDFSVAARF